MPDEEENDFMATNNLTNAWQAAYRIYGAAWFHELVIKPTNIEKLIYIPFDEDEADTIGLDNEDSLDDSSVGEDEEEDDVERSRFLGLAKSN